MPSRLTELLTELRTQQLCRCCSYVSPLQSGPQAGVSGAEKRAYALTQTIASLEERIKSARELYTVIRSRNQSELARMGLERETSFRRMFGEFAATQASLVQASADMWAGLARQFQAKE